jgi:hypothetical protein
MNLLVSKTQAKFEMPEAQYSMQLPLGFLQDLVLLCGKVTALLWDLQIIW